MNRLLSFLVLLFLALSPRPALAATYYVSPTGSGSVCSQASPCLHVYEGVAKLGAGDTLNIAPGTYPADYIYTAFGNITIQCTSSDATRCVLDGTGLSRSGADLSGANVTVKNLTLQNYTTTNYYGLLMSGANFLVDNVRVLNSGAAGTTTASVFVSDQYGTFNRLYIGGYSGARGYGIRLYNTLDNVVNIRYSIVDGGNGNLAKGIYDQSPYGVNFDNSIIKGASSYGYHAGASTTAQKNVRNSIISMYGTDAYSAQIFPIYANVNSVVVADRCRLQTAIEDASTYVYKADAPATVTITNEVITGNVFANAGYNQGIVVLSFDWDAYPDGVYKDMADILAEEGLEATFFVNRVFFAGTWDGDTDNILYVYNKGMDIGSHGWSHTRIGMGPPWAAFKMYYVGAGTCTLTVNATTLTTTITGGAGEQLSVNLADYSTGAAGLKSLSDFIDAKADYVATWVGTVVEREAQALILGDATAQDITGSGKEYTLPIDETRLLTHEIIDNNAWVEKLTGQPCVSYAWAGSNNTANGTAFLRALDGVSTGQKIAASRGAAGGNTNTDLAFYDILDGKSWPPNEMDRKTADDQLRSWTDAGMQARIYGKILHLYFHSDDWDGTANPTFGATMSAQARIDFRTGLRALKATGVTVLSMRQLRDYLSNNGWTYNGGAARWEKNLGTASTDYRLAGASPCRNAGDNGLWSGTGNIIDYSGRVKITDGAGTIIAPGGTVGIGAYEYRPQRGSVGLLGVGL